MPASQGHAPSEEERGQGNKALEGENEILEQKENTRKGFTAQLGWGRRKKARTQGTKQVKGCREKKSIDYLKAVSHLLPDSRKAVTEDSIQFNKDL